MTQSIRPSQFILTYGPGAILEGKNGPRIIPEPDIGIFEPNSQFNPWNYRIDDDRMSQGLLHGAYIFRLPTNAELNIGSEQFLYRTKAFPTWKLCLNQNNHNGPYILYQRSQCPICQNPQRTGQQEAIRFVTACSDGHLDEVPWDFIVHRGQDCSEANLANIPTSLRRTDSFFWHRRGGTLSEIEVECPRCGNRQNFGQAYYRPWHCTRRHPQRESLGSQPNRPMHCNRESRIIQRQAANLRLPEIRTLLSIQSTYTNLHILLQMQPIKVGIQMYRKYKGEIDSLGKLQEVLNDLVSEGHLKQSSALEFSRAKWSEVEQVLQDVQRPIPSSYHELISDEFNELIKASIGGAPPVRSPRPSSKIIFEVDPHSIKRIDTSGGRKLRITPIKTLRTITVQTGFRRELSETKQNNPPRIVDISFHDAENRQWYPGVEFLGEGLFIMFDGNDGWTDSFSEKHAREWQNGLSGADSYVDFVFRDPENSREELHPGFVWWHTLSHLLIRTISEESGYSSASIRERVYFEYNDSKFRGGVLLYATQPGSEGTLGGLIALASNFSEIFESAMEQLLACSGDPLCIEQHYQNGGYNGSACYGCLMNSETSCEHRNMWLDRNILIENLP